MKNNKSWNPLIRHLLIQYFLAIVLLSGLLTVSALVLSYFLQQKTWYGTEFWYPLLAISKRFFLPLLILGFLMIWIGATAFFIKKITNYLNEVIQGTSQLLENPEERVQLSATLFEVQEEMNLLREANNFNQRAAKEAEQRKNDLIVYLAHDLRTPLTSVIGYLMLLQEEPDISPETRARYTGIALDKANRLEQLIGEFFEITRFNLTTLILEKECIDVSMMLEQISYEFLPILDEKNLQWQLEIERDCQVLVDPDKIERVFDNLIRNAINYSYPDSVIQLHLKQVDNWVQIQFINHGNTIHPEKIQRIFEPFYRMDSARGTSTGGTGLGLPIAKEIVEAFDGKIIAESADNQIIFTLLLPSIKTNPQDSL